MELSTFATFGEENDSGEKSPQMSSMLMVLSGEVRLEEERCLSRMVVSKGVRSEE